MNLISKFLQSNIRTNHRHKKKKLIGINKNSWSCIFLMSFLFPFIKKSLDSARAQAGTRVITQLNTTRASDSHQQVAPPIAQGC